MSKNTVLVNYFEILLSDWTYLSDPNRKDPKKP